MQTVIQKTKQENYIDVNGERIYFTGKIESPEYQTLVLVHGAGSIANSWDLVTARFKESFNYIAIDLPGHFRSNGNPRKTIGAYAEFINDFVLAIMKEFKLVDNFTYVGHSLGGAIGIEVGVRQYSWLNSLILVATSSDFTSVSSPEFLERLKNGELDLSFYQRGFSPASPSAYYDAMVSRLGLVSIETTYADFYATSLFDNTNRLNDIKVDTLILSADDDQIMPSSAGSVLSEGIERNKWIQVANAGHFIILEQPEILANAIQSFVTKK